MLSLLLLLSAPKVVLLLPVNVAANATVLGINKLDMMKRANDIDIAFLIAFFEEDK
jgi:hypothetical protein